MKYFLLLFILLAFACSKQTDELEVNPSVEFKVFDALLYSDKPSLDQFGIPPVILLYQNKLWKLGQSLDFPIEENIRGLAKTLNSYGNPVVIDIEHWDLTGDEDIVATNIKKMVDVIEWMRSEKPEEKIGFYGEMPIRDYWRALKGGSGYEEWTQENLRLQELADHVDVIFPSLYTFYDNPDGWERYAVENIKEAHKYGKPVYAFLCPIYHNSNQELKQTHIDGQFWRRQLEICKKHADGIVIWGGWQKEWDPTLEWWIETKDFMTSYGRGYAYQ